MTAKHMSFKKEHLVKGERAALTHTLDKAFNGSIIHSVGVTVFSSFEAFNSLSLPVLVLCSFARVQPGAFVH